jgi:type II secretory pathway component GspD/PulD (secretin)
MRSLRLNVILLIAIIFSVNAVFAVTSSDLLNKKVTLNAEDASISNVVATMATQSGCNIVLANDVEGSDKGKDEKKLTISLKDVPVEQAIALVVKSIGLSYRLIGDKTFLVGDKKKIEEEIGERTYIVNLNYADAIKVAKALSIMSGEIVALEGQNSLLIKANPESYAEIKNRIEEMDTPLKQIEIRARLIEISVSDAKQFGIDWQKLNHLTTILAEDPANAAGEGLAYGDEDGAGYGDGTDLEALPETQYWQKLDGFNNVGHFSRQLTAFDITIDWLLQNNAGKILTDTRVTAMNGEEAEIVIGENVPYVARTIGDEYTVEREDVGIMLKIKPFINRDGKITAQIEPEVSSIIELVNGSIPRKNVRRIKSTVTVPEGKKIVVGGLLNSQIKKQQNKVPFLGDLPFVGKIFTHVYETLETTDMIIEITPTVVDYNESEWDIDERLEQRLIREK